MPGFGSPRDGTGSDYQVIVFQFSDRGKYQVLFPYDRFHFGQPEKEVFPLLENLTEREGDGARFESGRGHLVEQWRELVVVVLVNQYDLEMTTLQSVGKL